MKLRNITIIFTAIAAALAVFCLRETGQAEYRTVDTADLNIKYKETVYGLLKGEGRDGLEEQYGCRIILKEDAGYESLVMDAVKQNEIVLDYNIESASGDGEKAAGKIVFPGIGEKTELLRKNIQRRLIIGCILILIAGYVLIALIYYYYVRPFAVLKQFSSDVAKGNLDVPLKITKGNYFGSFTESFDIMREELKKAKENEYRANMSKKELVAELSHDMKTPVAAIKAACELMRAKESRAGDLYGEDILEKTGIIEQKANMLEKLTDNMFHATLEELENLKVEPLEMPSTIMEELLLKFGSYGNIHLLTKVPECLVYMDSLRFEQVLDNIVNNSYKYAGTPIEVSFREQEDGIVMVMRDYGPGIPEEELPLVSGKFYRGSNAKGKTGAGLGLYLAVYFMEHMEGDFACYNDNGFVAELFLRKAAPGM